MISIKWIWDGKIWTEIDAPHRPPAPRQAWYSIAGGNLAFFWRLPQRRGRRIRLGDTWEWPDTAARFNPAMAYDNTKYTLIRFGAWTQEGRVEETWSYDSAQWTTIADDGPSARNHTAMAYDVHREHSTVWRTQWRPGLGDTRGWDGHVWLQM